MDQRLFDTLNDLRQRDINTRERLLKEGRLYGVYDEEMQSVHRENAKELHRLISIHGWPGISKVGIEGSRLAWSIAQNANCTPDLQRAFLHYMIEASQKGDVPKKQVALLTDRIRFNEGRPQVYGTVLDWDEHGELGCELEHANIVDKLREEVGLSSFAISLQEHSVEIAVEGATPPADMDAYKAAASAWAKSVGWRR